MSTQQILSEVNAIFREVLDDDALVLQAETTAKDVPEWDSLSHVQLVVAVERHFKVKFTAAEIRGLANVGAMCAAIASKLAR